MITDLLAHINILFFKHTEKELQRVFLKGWDMMSGQSVRWWTLCWTLF